MTEAQWLTSDDPVAMLEMLRNLDAACARHDAKPGYQVRFHDADYDYPQLTDRKLRLFACACLRAFGPRRGRERVLVPQVEALADRGATEADYVALDDLLLDTGADWARRWAQRPDVDQAAQANLLRCLFGNPFREVRCLCGAPCREIRAGYCAAARPLRTPFVRVIAHGIYRDRDWGALPILADALEEAGCPAEVACAACGGKGEGVYGLEETPWTCDRCGATGRLPNPLLVHLRSDGPHARGCWCVDLILGKT